MFLVHSGFGWLPDYAKGRMCGKAHSGSVAFGIRIPHLDALHPVWERDLNLEDPSRLRGIFRCLCLHCSDPALPGVPALEAAHSLASQRDHHMGCWIHTFHRISFSKKLESEFEGLF